MQAIFLTITVSKNSLLPVYLQLAETITEMIRKGDLKAGDRLPSTRQLAQLLQVHRKTVVRAYDDLLAQGWLESETGNGTFVARNLPEAQARRLSAASLAVPDPVKVAGFAFEQGQHLNRGLNILTTAYHLDDGYPDARLAPLHDLSRAYRTQLLTGNPYTRLGYADTQGSLALREQLSKHLNITRALPVTADNILITRGSVMGLYLACTSLLKHGDRVVAGSPGWLGAETNFAEAGADLIKIRVDQYGICLDELEQICSTKTVRLVYVTPHHHYPTTVSLRADRRIQLLRLSEKYGFIIFEDDYDYDFHYLNKPLLPLASADQQGMVLYCGSFTKTISPAFRVGYLVGPVNVIQQMAKLRRIIDRQGDLMLENAIAELLEQGVIQRHLRKSLRLYRQRRDLFCDLLSAELNNYLQFVVPEGGMSVWTCFDPKINLEKLSRDAKKKDLYFSDGRIHHTPFNLQNATRLGFASSSAMELEHCVEILARLLKKGI